MSRWKSRGTKRGVRISFKPGGYDRSTTTAFTLPLSSLLPPSWTSFLVLPDEEVHEHFLRFVSRGPFVSIRFTDPGFVKLFLFVAWSQGYSIFVSYSTVDDHSTLSGGWLLVVRGVNFYSCQVSTTDSILLR